MARPALVVLALVALLSRRSPPTVRARALAAEHDATLRALTRQQLLCVWSPASGGDA